ncbi:MAG: 3'-5' exonuclease [Polyangiaceae bacterium]
MASGNDAKSGEPPRGSPWDDPLDSAPLAFIDLELTGLRAATDRVIEVCIERVRGGAVEDRLATLVRPDPPVMGNVHIHNIEPHALADAPTYPEIAGRIQQILTGAIVVAHAAWHDVEFLAAEHARAGIAFDPPPYVDTLSLSRRAFALKSHSLVALCQTLGIPHDRPHRAEPDVAAMRAVFEKIVGVLRPATPRDLWHVRVGERHARPEVLACASRAVEQGSDVVVRYRPAHRGPEDLKMRLTAVRTDLDPPRVLGYLLASRGRRELRADRILAIFDGQKPALPA